MLTELDAAGVKPIECVGPVSYTHLSILIIDKFHYFIRAVLEKNLPLQEYILKFMQFAEKNKDTIVIEMCIRDSIYTHPALYIQSV